MPISIPTVAEIRDHIVSDFETAFGLATPIPAVSFFRKIATVLAGAMHLLYLFGGRISKNILPSTAQTDRLEDFGVFLGLPRNPAVSFQGDVDFISNVPNDTIPAGTLLVSILGVEYSTTVDLELDGAGLGTVGIQSTEAGEKSNLSVGNTLSLVAPREGVTSVTVSAVATEGSDQEPFDDYRDRVIERFSQRPQGGAKSDYIAWAKTVTGVTRVFPYYDNFSAVYVYFVRDNDSPRIPTAGEIQDVIDAIDTADRLPVGDYLQVLAPTERSFDVEITSTAAIQSATQTQIDSAISDYLLAKEMFVDNNITAANAANVASIDIAGIARQFSDTVVSATVTTSGLGIILAYTLTQGEMATAGLITYMVSP